MEHNTTSNAIVGATVDHAPRPRGHGRPAGALSASGPSRSIWAELFGSTTLPPAAVVELHAIVTWRELPAGSLLVSRHDPARDLIVLARGDAALGVAHDDLPFQPERSLQGPDWLDAASAWLDANHAQDAIALSDVQVLALPRLALQPVLARQPELARHLLLVLAKQVHLLTSVAHDLMHKDAETRFAAWLLQRSVPAPGSPDSAVVALHERKRDIAAQLGITPETLSRLLRQLSRKGLIDVKGYTVSVLDLSALRALAGN